MTTVTQGNASSFTFTGADSVTVTPAAGAVAHVAVISAAGVQKYKNAFRETRNIGPFSTGDVLSVTAVGANVDYVTLVGDATTLSGNYTLKASDDGQSFKCLSALTISIPDGLSPRPTITAIPPPSGNLSIAMLGSETVNGATTTLTRTRANNPAGIALAGYKDAAAYGLSGT